MKQAPLSAVGICLQGFLLGRTFGDPVMHALVSLEKVHLAFEPHFILKRELKPVFSRELNTVLPLPAPPRKWFYKVKSRVNLGFTRWTQGWQMAAVVISGCGLLPSHMLMWLWRGPFWGLELGQQNAGLSRSPRQETCAFPLFLVGPALANTP